MPTRLEKAPHFSSLLYFWYSSQFEVFAGCHTLNCLTKLKSLNPNIKEIGLIKIRADLTNRGCKTIDKIIKSKSWFFEKVNKMDKPFARLSKKKREKIFK